MDEDQGSEDTEDESTLPTGGDSLDFIVVAQLKIRRVMTDKIVTCRERLIMDFI